MASPYGFNRGLPNRNRDRQFSDVRYVAGNNRRAGSNRNAITQRVIPPGARHDPDAARIRAQINRQGLPGNGPFNATATVGGRGGVIRGGQGPAPLPPERIQRLTEKLKATRGTYKTDAAAQGSKPYGPKSAVNQDLQRIHDIRGVLQGRRNTPMPTPTPGTPSPGLVPGTHIPIGDIGIPGVPGSYPPGRGPTPSGGVIQGGGGRPIDDFPRPQPGGVPRPRQGGVIRGGKPGNQDRIRAAIRNNRRGYTGRPLR